MAQQSPRKATLPFRSPSDLKGLRVTVMGLGTKGGGVEVVKYLVRRKARVTATDLKTAKELQPSVDALKGLPVNLVLGLHRDEDFLEADLIIPNPAVPVSSPYLERARKAGIPMETDIALFFAFSPAPIAAVTGTRGKTTTTTVAGAILRENAKDTVVAGNIQRSPLADLDRMTPNTPAVLELSSWQLEGLVPHKRSPHWALMTTLLPDHLNRYASFEDYAAAKETIFRYQTAADVLILPTDDARLAAHAGKAKGRVLWFGPARSDTPARQPDGSHGGGRSVSGGPVRAASEEAGLFWENGRVYLAGESGEEELLSWAELGGTGEHTKRNMLAGALLALVMGAPKEKAQKVLREFRGVPHRLETVRVLAGRTFVNDTTATTPEAVVAALRSFPDHRLVLITGGTDKRLAYDALARALTGEAPQSSRGDYAEQVAHVVLLDGSATKKLRELLARTKFTTAPVVRIMADAVREAAKRSLPGDVVLMSPGAASFELFRDEFDRGDQFRAAVEQLTEEHVRR